MRNNENLEALKAVLADIEIYDSAFKLLEEVYAELGPYAHFKDKTISQELQRKLNDFFKFDDSE